MNRKEAIIVGALLITTFFGSAFAAPAVQNMFIVNDPLNVRIVGGTASTRTTSVDIDLLDIVPGIRGDTGVQLIGASSGKFNYTASFSFSPAAGFTQVNLAYLTAVYATTASFNVGDMLSVQLNGGPFTSDLLQSVPSSIIVAVRSESMRVGSNLIDVGVIPTVPATGTSILLYQLRLTVEYTFLG